MTTTNTMPSLPRVRKLRMTGFNRLFSPLGQIALLWIAFLVLLVVFAPVVAPYDPNHADLMNVLSGPSAAHWLGTDSLGRDLFSRIIFGGRTALIGPLIVVSTATAVGIFLGLIAAWRGGWLDALLARIFDFLFAFPALLLAILAIALFGKGLTGPVIAMTVAYIPFIARLARGLIIEEMSRPYVQAYQVLGFRSPWIAVTRVLPNIFPVVGAQATLYFGYVLADLAALSFIGLGVQAPQADWGAMINESRGSLQSGELLPTLVPAVVVILIVVAINIVGEELSERIGGKLR